MRLISSLNVFSIKNNVMTFEHIDLNKMSNTQKLNTLLNLDNKDDLLIVGYYLKNLWQHRKEFFGKK
jgi:hypothetical protein